MVIKIHPEEHGYPIREYGMRLFEFAAQHNAVVLAHSGDPLSLPADFVGPADAFPYVKLFFAHLGNGGGATGDPTLQVAGVSPFLITPLAATSTFLLAALLGMLFPSNTPSRGEEFSLRAIMRK